MTVRSKRRVTSVVVAFCFAVTPLLQTANLAAQAKPATTRMAAMAAAMIQPLTGHNGFRRSGGMREGPAAARSHAASRFPVRRSTVIAPVPNEIPRW